MTLRTAAALVALVALSAGVTACGKVGQLEHPGPLFGTKANPDRSAANRPQDPSRPVQTVDPRDRSTDPVPPRTLPIEGTSPSPTAVAPPGALPDPYANPARR